MNSKSWKLKYLGFFSISLISGFYSFMVFIPLATGSNFNPLFIVLNSLILLITWFFSFTFHHEFVRKNFYSLVVLPLILIYVNNIVVGFVLKQLNIELFQFIAASAVLVLTSQRASTFKLKLQEAKKQSETVSEPFES